MAKPYTLDLTIYSAKDRCEAVTKILDSIPYFPGSYELESLSNYILYGRDEETALSSVDRREIIPTKRFNSYRRKDDKQVSIEAMRGSNTEDDGLAKKIDAAAHPLSRNIYKKVLPQINRPTYDEAGNLLDPGDSDIPGMVELWERIDNMQRRFDMYCGKIPPTLEIRSNPASTYQLYLMRHTLYDIRRNQYWLKDSYKPRVLMHSFPHSEPHTIDYSVDGGLWLEPEEWCERKRHPKPYDEPQPTIEEVPRRQRPDGTELWYWVTSHHNIDLKNPFHIYQVLRHYKRLLLGNYEKLNSGVRALLWDIERLVEESNFTELEQYVLEELVAGHSYFMIFSSLQADLNVTKSPGQITKLCRTIIPQKLAATAARLEDESDFKTGKIPGLQCTKCGQTLPRTTTFFARSNAKQTGFCSRCKKCQKEVRVNAAMPKV